MNALHDKSSVAIRETANEWAARLHEPQLDHAQKVAFTAWLRASPIHVREYLNAEALRDSLKDVLARDTTDIKSLLRDEPANVIELATPARVERSPARGRFTRWAAAAVVLLIVGVAATLHFQDALEPSTYSTAVGQIRRLTLADGSVIELNTDSKIRVAFNARGRDIHLTQGEVFFTVAKDPQRPFRVLSASAVVRAIGTQFSVYRKPVGTVVTVVEGKVAAQDKGNTLELIAGQQVTLHVSPAKTSLVRANAVDAKRATAWRQRRLIFDNQPLSEVVAEFNRYNRRQMVIDDAELATQGISGVFDPEKPQGLLLFLDKKGGVQAIEASDDTIVLTR